MNATFLTENILRAPFRIIIIVRGWKIDNSYATIVQIQIKCDLIFGENMSLEAVGLFIDELSKLHIVDPSVLIDTHTLKDVCHGFLEGNFLIYTTVNLCLLLRKSVKKYLYGFKFRFTFYK